MKVNPAGKEQVVIIVGEQCNRERDKVEGESGCATDDPFSGVNKDKDVELMHQVTFVNFNLIISQSKRVDATIASELAKRYRKGKSFQLQA